MKRRFFLKNTFTLGVGGALVTNIKNPYITLGYSLNRHEQLYNGIVLPEIWPPKNIDAESYTPMPVPYRLSPPKVIPIDIGRQLFVDDFLIEKTSLKRKYHNARKIRSNPIFSPQSPLERDKERNPVACPKDGGVWWDTKDQLFKMWYEAGWVKNLAYCISRDGINWERPELDVLPGTNCIVPELNPDSTTVWLDHFTENTNERFKMFLREPGPAPQSNGFCMTSSDGIHWSNPVKTGICGDRSTVFYNPFRKKWIFSIRANPLLFGRKPPLGRARFYREHNDFINGATWDSDEIVYWTAADYLDKPDPNIGDNPQLYNLSAVGYESIMLGLHEIHLGPSNEICHKKGIPKITELKVSFSRDGFHWDRPHRDAFISATRNRGDWDRGYVQSVGGVCVIVGDELWFYYTGFKGDEKKANLHWKNNGMYSDGSTGIAILRRDGFASMEAKDTEGYLLTKLLIFRGKYLFVNTDCSKGELKVEVLDKNNKIIYPYTKDNCEPISFNKTICQIKWKQTSNLNKLIGHEVKFRFQLKNGKLYSFWLSHSELGESNGYMAAGGPGYENGIDKTGFQAYFKASQFLKLRNL